MKKNHLILNVVRLAIVACFLSAVSAYAGPEFHAMYVPVKAKELAKIKPGTKLAFTCPKCQGVIGVTADAEKSYEKDVSCPGCKTKFVHKEIGGHGKTLTTVVYVDAEGHEATLLHAM